MPAEADYEDREHSDRRGAPPPPSSDTRPLPGSDSDDEPGSKRKHKKKDKDERASKRHKEHKKHKKHKKDKDDGSSDDEKEKQNGRRDEDRSPEDRKRDSPRRGSPLRNRSQDRSPQQRERRRSRSPPRRRSRSYDRGRRSPPRRRPSPPRRGGYNDRGSDRGGYRREGDRGGYDRRGGRDDRGRGDDRDDRRGITEERRQDELRKEKERDEAEAKRKKEEEEAYQKSLAAQFEDIDDEGELEFEDEEEKAERERKERKERMEKIKAEAAKKALEKAQENADKRAAEIAAEEQARKENGTAQASGNTSPADEGEQQEDEVMLAAITPRAKGQEDSEPEEDDDDQQAADVNELDETQQGRNAGLSPRKEKHAELEANKTYDIFDKESDEIAAIEVKAIDRGGNVLDQENFDDKDGYLTFQMGEHFNERYKVESVLGKGVFSTVLRAIDTKFPAEQTKDKKPVYTAIKIIRNNDMMAKASAKELEMLKLLSKDGAADKHHIVQLSDDFVHHGHMCLVFEPMAMNLREVIKKFGHNRGINIEGVQVFSKQMFQALKHIRKCKIVHADIKPDNILINERHNAIKICDFGSGSYINECDITPYLVSRWYRAPEITLCLRYDYAIDLWSIGCCMYELYTGKVMFPGNSNNDMLRRFHEIMGRFPNKLIKRSMTKMIELGRPVDFTEDFKFLRIMIDKITKKETVKILTIDEKPVKDLLKLLMPTTLQPDQARKVKQLEQILRGALSLNPDNRFSIEQCLSHPFVKEPFGFVPKRREAPAPTATA